jgi:prepilin-type N-terminal cleavage/methylation domain-containing protein
MTNYKSQKGISLIEILVVVSIFALVGVLVTRSLTLTLQGTQKSTSLVHARENLDYSISVIERQIRAAESISDCTNSNTNAISYVDQSGIPSSFSCVNTGLSNSYVASGSARLTSDTVKITGCSFICTVSGSGPSAITIGLTMQDAATTGIGGAGVSASTKIYLRNY